MTSVYKVASVKIETQCNSASFRQMCIYVYIALVQSKVLPVIQPKTFAGLLRTVSIKYSKYE